MCALMGGEGAGVDSRMLYPLQVLKPQGAVTSLHSPCVQLCLACPALGHPLGGAVVGEDDQGVVRGQEGPGEIEVTQVLRGCAGEGEVSTLNAAQL